MEQRENVTFSTLLSKPRMALLVMNYGVGYMYVYPMMATYITVFIDPYARDLLPGLDLAIYIFMIVFCILVGWPLLKEEYVILKHEKQDIFHKVGICFENLAYIYLANFLFGGMIQRLSQSEVSANQSSIAQSALNKPVLTIFMTLIFAPIVEEIVFRGAIYRLIRSKYHFMKAAIISSFLFGFIHVYFSLFTHDYYDLWNIFLYAIPGFFIAKAYEETHSIYGSIFIHFMNNAISILFLLS